MAPRSVFSLFERQADALESPLAELLVGGSEGRCGASHLLRVAAIFLAASAPDAQVLLLQRNFGDLRRNHLEGETGLRRLLADAERRGAVQWAGESREVRWPHGSVIRWSGCARETEISRLVERRIDALLIDDLDDVPEDLYRRLRDVVLNGASPIGRIIAASHRPDQGWVARHWNGASPPERGFLRMSPRDLPEDLARAPERVSYRDFLVGVHGGALVFPPHVALMVDDVDRWAADEWDHLAILVPSQHGKTTAGPRNAVPYILRRDPSVWCGIVSYDSNLAGDRSADARDNFAKAGGELRPGRNLVRAWQTLEGGGCWAAGSQAGQAGRSASYGFPDDPDKDWFDAVNKRAQAKKRRWWGSVFRARESMFATEGLRMKLLFTVTRWDPEDLAGFAMNQGHLSGERWALRVLPALYDPAILDGYRALYPRFEILPDFRTRPGEPIWEDRRAEAEWRAVLIQRGPLIFDCECQQAPRGAERGGKFEAEWFNRLDRDPAFLGKEPREEVYLGSCRAWDLAATSGAGDWTAGSKAGRTEKGRTIVRHVVRAQLSSAGVRQLIAAAMLLDGPTVKVRIPIDPAAGGVAQAEAIVSYLREVSARVGRREPEIVAERPLRLASATESAKANRARPLQSVAEPPGKGIPGGVDFVGAEFAPAVSDVVENFEEIAAEWPELRAIAERGALLAGDWWTPWLREMEAFTGADGRTDDQVDATVDAHDEIAEPEPALVVF